MDEISTNFRDRSWIEQLEEKLEKLKKEKRRKFKRYALIGLATLGGGTLIGLTGGLAAPLVAAGAGAIIGGTGAAVLGSTAGVAIIGSLFSVAGAGLTGYKMKKRFGAIEEFEFEPLVCGNSLRVDTLSNQLHITIAVTGWLTNEFRDFKQPWKNLAESREQYILRYETKYLVQMGEALDYIFNSAMTMAAQEVLKQTVLNGILTAIAWPSALISAANFIDNPWSVALQRSQTAGKALAEVLLAREQGNRPVTLIGFSLGARVIFSCLEELTIRKGGEGIVEDVILLGTPATGDPAVWASFTKVVAGKIVNGYCRGDWLLKFLYRTSSVQINIAGLRPIKWTDRRMHNIDLSDVVHGHLDYKHQLDTILKAVGIQTRDEIHQFQGSSKEATPLQTPDQAPETAPSELAYDEGDEKKLGIVPDISTPSPVILEDYSPDGTRSGSLSGWVLTDTQDKVIPESASFDSGVEVYRRESESREKLASPEYTIPGAHPESNHSSSAAPSVDTLQLSGLEQNAALSSVKRQKGDRIGDAGVNGDGLDEETDAGKGDESPDDLQEKVEDEASTLQRKKLFDSMYRLVLDDDLMDVMNDDDYDDNAPGDVSS
ncbi:Transmembrane and coiled-coil domain-containing protein 4 [Bulinus truncatus]|nr:Transmembrane and coiled-coil domain-containing protein 4 [Bulinus truncatus]